jgi:predicted secreted protein with PEFG-CTERM motif
MNSKIAVAVGLAAAAVLAATILAPVSAPTPAFAAKVAVDITASASTKTTNAYSPNPVEINVGDTVIWTNQDAAAHSATSGEDATPTGLFGDPSASGSVLVRGRSQSFTFTEAGEYPYYCFLHPNMVGTVVVVVVSAAGGGGNGGTPQEFRTTAAIGGNNYEITGVSATATATAATINPGQKSVQIAFDGSGQVELTLPKSMIGDINAVMAGDGEVEYSPTDNGDSTTIAFAVPEGATSVDIMAGYVVPEFPFVAILILAASLVAIVGYTRFAKSGTRAGLLGRA